MPLHSITIKAFDSCDPSYITDVLFELGALSVSVCDLNKGTADEYPIYGEPSQEGIEQNASTVIWPQSKITALYPLSFDMEALLMNLATDFDLRETPNCTIYKEVFDDKDPETWVQLVQQSFQPVIIERIRISFPWHESQQGYLNIRLEPGMAFGTGEHITTQLCLSWLQKRIKPSQKILDFGTGSGVLSIAAVMLQPNVTAVGVDLDPIAVKTAKKNAIRNKAAKQIYFCENHQEPVQETYDIVVANILAGPLRTMSQMLVSRMKTGARIALSGILASQATNIIECYQEHGLSFEDSHVVDGWALVNGIKG